MEATIQQAFENENPAERTREIDGIGMGAKDGSNKGKMGLKRTALTRQDGEMGAKAHCSSKLNEK